MLKYIGYWVDIVLLIVVEIFIFIELCREWLVLIVNCFSKFISMCSWCEGFDWSLLILREIWLYVVM